MTPRLTLRGIYWELAELPLPVVHAAPDSRIHLAHLARVLEARHRITEPSAILVPLGTESHQPA